MTSSGFGVFGTGLRTRILLAIYLLKETHTTELARLLGAGNTTVRNALDTLEQARVIGGVMEGNTRRIRLEPRFYAHHELCALLEKMAFADASLLESVTKIRRRPRRTGKKL